TLNGQVAQFRAGEISSVIISPGGGRNAIALEASASGLPVTINVAGDDTISGINPTVKINQTGGTLTISTHTTITSLTVTGGTLIVSSDVSVESLTFSGGTITGSEIMFLAGNSTWSGGTFSGSGVTTVGFGTTLTLSGIATKTLDQRRLMNNGTIAWTAGDVTATNGATLNNTATGLFDAQTNSRLTGNGTFVNAGTLRKSTLTGTTTVQLTFTNTGSVEARTGTLDLAGAFTNFASATLTGGTYLVVQATLRFVNPGLWTNAATIV